MLSEFVQNMLAQGRFSFTLADVTQRKDSSPVVSLACGFAGTNSLFLLIFMSPQSSALFHAAFRGWIFCISA